MMLWADSLFWRYGAAGVLSVSPECERQVRELAGRLEVPAVQYRALYKADQWQGIADPSTLPRVPFIVVFAGRVERDKGVFDILHIAETVEKRVPGKVIFRVCGNGAALSGFRETVTSKGLDAIVQITGPLRRPDLLNEYARCHLVIVPTRSTFCEGMPRSCAEAILSGRPVLTTKLSNASDVMPGAIIEAVPDNPKSYAQCIIDLLHEPESYARACAATTRYRAQFLDEKHGLLAALDTIFTNVCRGPISVKQE